jgi:valyl-tRNA synthetase
MEIAKTYNPHETEDKWYKYWLDNNFFKSTPDHREPYTIVIPPPNVTGVLHMGHMLNNTIQDVLIRKARMQGKNACWVPGTDHASIATETKVVNLLKEKGISKKDISREEFLKHAWEWKEKYGGIILEQLKKLGASCDWDRTRFTMEEDLSEAVIEVFIDLYKKGHIYRGYRMVNWDPVGKTALSDEEVNHKEANSNLYYINYKIEGSENEFVTIATTRPETIMADSAVCINPEDERYTHLKGERVFIPLINKSIPIIYDEYVDKEFGTGCLKVTPAHDINDYNLGQKHGLEIIDIFTEEAKLNEKAQIYVGEDRFVVRKKIAKELEEKGFISKVEQIKNNVGHSERTDAVIEPRLSMQWYLKMGEISKPALENVLNGEINLIPEKFVNTYKHWMENVHDWCISRQLWWGHRIPAWYDTKGNFTVAKTKEEAYENLKKQNPTINIDDVKQDEDVLDTWFSSWLWPISVFDGFKNPENPDIKYYYPTNDLVTAPEILFFWVARMIIAGYEYRGQKPFKNVYLTGIVRDKLGRKMSKSLGNSPDPLDLISKFGADGVRTGMLFSSPAGNDLPFDEKLCEQGRNFSNKIWNAFRLIKGWKVEDITPNPSPKGEENKVAIDWMNARLNAVLVETEDLYSKYRISDALQSIYKLVWDDFCAWYLEMIKPGFEQPIDAVTYNATIEIFEKLMQILHPFMPFITEELWHSVKEREAKDCIIISSYPVAQSFNKDLQAMGEKAIEIVSQIRNIRSSKGMSPKVALELLYKGTDTTFIAQFEAIIKKMANLESITITDSKPEKSVSFVIKSEEFFVPLALEVNADEEREKIMKELEYTKGFLVSVMKKLENEKFVNSAPADLVAKEKQKQADAEARIMVLEESLKQLA